MKKTVFWDWNGTILDDLELTVAIENELFDKYGYRRVSVEEYLRIFHFPVADYYRQLGVPGDVYAAMNDQWLARYRQLCGGCGLRTSVPETLRKFRDRSCRQVILSASRQDVLREQVASYPELDGMFERVLGLQDGMASSKVQLALDFLKEDGLDPAQAVFLGDTTHDAEVAAATGCGCILIEGGHQCREVLEKTGVPVVRDAAEAAILLEEE